MAPLLFSSFDSFYSRIALRSGLIQKALARACMIQTLIL